ncbi:SRPBCC family protein [Kiritimatiellota bacterium B12222]|nr:SRPBCC family protein [Kiritimatiellota bacterium B12222]
MPRIELRTKIKAPVGVVFDLARDIDLHQQSQASRREKAVAGTVSGLIEEGEWVTWEAVHLGIRQRLTSKVTHMERPRYFRDVMVSGAFKRFDHDHYFEFEAENRTMMVDIFDYTSPFGFWGRLADRLFLRTYMVRLLQERNAEIQQVAEHERT